LTDKHYRTIVLERATQSFAGCLLHKGFSKMDKLRLHTTLEQLHSELQQIESVDENERQLLQKLTSDIKKLVEAGASDQHHVAQLDEGLREGIERFEASHPRATMLMGQVIDALSKIGI
jgi:predicted RNA-binding protein with EMAP domain